MIAYVVNQYVATIVSMYSFTAPDVVNQCGTGVTYTSRLSYARVYITTYVEFQKTLGISMRTTLQQV